MSPFQPTLLLLPAALATIAVGCSDGGLSKLTAADRLVALPLDGGDASTGPTLGELRFRALESDLDRLCGNVCHTTGSYSPVPPTFLALPDQYASVRAHSGIVMPDPNESSLITRGAHAGPALSDDKALEGRVRDWLTAEAVAIQNVTLPTTNPFALVSGNNDVDLSRLCTGSLTAVHLTFQASMLGDILQLSNLTLSVPAGTDAHLLKMRIVKIRPEGDGGVTEFPDPGNTFENLDVTVPGGADTVIATLASFTAEGFAPFEMASDKIRIEASKLEPGQVRIVEVPKVCKDATGFTQRVLPNMRGGGGFNLNCANCHDNGLGGLSLNDGDRSQVCTQVLGKLNQTNIGQSLIITKVTAGPHTGGIITDAAGWAKVFTDNAGIFF